MANENKLVKNTLLYAIANFGSKFLTFLMLPLYTHYFTTSEYGLWDLIVTTSTLLTPFITFELVAAVYRWLLDEEREESRKSIITTGAIAILRNLLIFNLLGVIIIITFPIPYGIEALIFINVTVASSFLQQCARGLGYNKLFAASGMIQAAVTVISILFFIFVLELRLEAFFYASILAGISVVTIAWKVMGFGRYLSSKTYSKKMLTSFLLYSVPIIPGAVSWWIMSMSDRYFIIAYLGMEYNGIYAVANKIPALLLMVHTVFSLAWKDSAIVAFHSDDKNEYYSTVFRYFFRLMTTSVICITLLAKPILDIVVADAFFDSWKFIGILLLGTLFSAFSQFWGAGFHGAKKTNIIFTTTFVGAGINVLFNLIFINVLGLYTVAISTFLAFFTMWVIRVFASTHYFKITMNKRDLFVLFLLIIGATVAPFVLSHTGVLISIVIGIALFFVYNKDAITLIRQASRSFLHK
ncbi:oligosaccharide flippase family protein [Virgibacillus sp. NKC19-3]|uniref:lipopolysaccharide biosynthesis protein n=1 Tax=Virgibacillus saliphilus TaxID=2831674 RepID=UPI001C9B858B|nr:polysaccharide biosynthesis C-terminal domain-containing protein [Virgibacillus sp. NKC19-3]MBY7144646.1 oligosaccharide flippase family protein [Virgibacillus sp. NKC19-3]